MVFKVTGDLLLEVFNRHLLIFDGGDNLELFDAVANRNELG